MGSLLWPGQEPEQTRLFPPRTTEDLQLERLCAFMAYNNYFKLSVADILKTWTDDPAVIAWRQDVLRDLLDNPALPEALDQLLDCIDVWESRSGAARQGQHDPKAMEVINLSDFSFLDSYIERISSLADTFDGLTLRSEGMQRLGRQIQDMRNSQRFDRIRDGFEQLCKDYAMPSRISIAFNLDAELKPTGVKLLRVERKQTKRRKLDLTRTAYNGMGSLLGKTVTGAGQGINMFVRRESMELRALKQDLIFYLSALKLCRAWEAVGLPYCFPEIRPAGEKAFTAAELFNPLLVLTQREQIVCNDIAFAPGGELLILTGANQGGKTVFLQSVALAQWLFQLGAAAPCRSASISPATEIVTVFAPSGADFTRHGLLAEEAGRIAHAVDLVTPGSLVLFNEPLNSTSPSENLAISRDVIAAFKAGGVRGVWVTHLYELASGREEMNARLSWGSTLGSIRIVVAHDETGTHPTYKIIRGEPEFNSYAAEVLRRKGVEIG